MKRILSAILMTIMLGMLCSCTQIQEAPAAAPTPAATPTSIPPATSTPTVTDAWGILDFMKDVNGGTSPVSAKLGEDEFAQYIVKTQLEVQMENVSFVLEEALFDGLQLHAVFTVKANDKAAVVLMTQYGYSPDDTIFYASGETGTTEQTFAEKAAAENKSILSVAVFCRDDDAIDGVYTEQYHTDGSVTIYLCQNFLEVSDVQRSFQLEFRERKDDAEQTSSTWQEVSLSPCGEWEKLSTNGTVTLNGAAISAMYIKSQFEAYETIRFDLSSDMSPADVEDWFNFWVEQTDAVTGDVIPELGSGIMMTGPNGEEIDSLSAGDSVIFFVYLQSDTVIPETINVKLFRAFSDGSEVGNAQIRFE